MNHLVHIKNNLIDNILATNNENLLEAIATIFKSAESESLVSLSSEQIEILLMSEENIKNGELISEENLEKEDSKWMQ